jgi:hypothetical protein
MGFGTLLLEHRRAAGLSQEDLAAALALTGQDRATFVAPPPDDPAPAQLPRMLGDFFGRTTVLDALTALLTGPAGIPAGPGGIGKTTLAVQLAHRVATRQRPNSRVKSALGTTQDSAAAARTARELAEVLGDPEILDQARAAGPVS